MGIYFRDILLTRISRGANNCGQHPLEKNSYFIMRFSPHFQLFYFNDRLEFSKFFEGKIKRINNADLFSQLPLLYLSRVPIVEDTVCKDEKMRSDLNFDPIIRKTNNRFNMWLQRDLSLQGRVLLSKREGISRSGYVCLSLDLPSKVVKTLDKLLFDFIWKKNHII